MARKKRKKKSILDAPKRTPEIVLDKFLVELTVNGGDATKAAMKVFNYAEDREWQAAVVGSKLLQELGPRKDEILRMKLEQETGGVDWMVKELKKKIEKSSKTEWWDRGMKIAGYGDFAKKDSNVTISINQTHRDYANEYIEGEIEEVEEVKEIKS